MRHPQFGNHGRLKLRNLTLVDHFRRRRIDIPIQCARVEDASRDFRTDVLVQGLGHPDNGVRADPRRRGVPRACHRRRPRTTSLRAASGHEIDGRGIGHQSHLFGGIGGHAGLGALHRAIFHLLIATTAGLDAGADRHAILVLLHLLIATATSLNSRGTGDAFA